VYEVWHWERWSQTLFSDFIKKMQTLKVSAEGWPNPNMTDDQKRAYRDGYRQHEGIDLVEEDIRENKGLRHCGKLVCLSHLQYIFDLDLELSLGEIR